MLGLTDAAKTLLQVTTTEHGTFIKGVSTPTNYWTNLPDDALLKVVHALRSNYDSVEVRHGLQGTQIDWFVIGKNKRNWVLLEPYGLDVNEMRALARRAAKELKPQPVWTIYFHRSGAPAYGLSFLIMSLFLNWTFRPIIPAPIDSIQELTMKIFLWLGLWCLTLQPFLEFWYGRRKIRRALERMGFDPSNIEQGPSKNRTGRYDYTIHFPAR